MKIYFSEEIDVTEKMIDDFKKAAHLCLSDEDIDYDRCELSVSFVDRETIRNINFEYRNKDEPTDVLSFPQYESKEDLPEEGSICLGDVVICTDKALEQAKHFGHSEEREIVYLFVHSILHLIGYDHMNEEDMQKMRQKEEQIMEVLHLRREHVVSDKELFQMAIEASKNAYAPFSKFKVGAALLSKDGRVFTGVNVENSSYGATICAERTACTKAVSEGVREFEAIAIVANESKVFPCGICRQFLYEFAPDLQVITGENENDLVKWKLSELLAEGFKL